MLQYTTNTPEEELNRYVRHGLASIPLTTVIDVGKKTILLTDLPEGQKYAWISKKGNPPRKLVIASGNVDRITIPPRAVKTNTTPELEVILTESRDGSFKTYEIVQR